MSICINRNMEFSSNFVPYSLTFHAPLPPAIGNNGINYEGTSQSRIMMLKDLICRLIL